MIPSATPAAADPPVPAPFALERADDSNGRPSAPSSRPPANRPAAPGDAWFPDWRRRLARNLARRSDGRWDPLTRTDG